MGILIIICFNFDPLLYFLYEEEEGDRAAKLSIFPRPGQFLPANGGRVGVNFVPCLCIRYAENTYEIGIMIIIIGQIDVHNR